MHHLLQGSLLKAERALLSAPQARQPEPLLSLRDAWDALLPPALHRHILDTLVFPKVGQANCPLLPPDNAD